MTCPVSSQVDPEDIFLSEWNCSILGPDGTTFAQRFYELRVTCDANYPSNPPTVRFVSAVNMSNVNGTGVVVRSTTFLSLRCSLCALRQDLSNSPSLRKKGGWNRNMGIEEALTEIRNDMSDSSSKRLAQPPEGQNF